MDMTNFKDGTILDNIIQTNERLSEQLKLKVDLRTPTCMDEED
jgi:predicted nucleotidyltransferase